MRRCRSEPRLTAGHVKYTQGLRQAVTFTARRFDVTTLPADLQRVYKALSEDYGEEYALTVCFVVRTAVELHRAWHMTLLTSKLLQQIKDKFGLRMTWDLGVIHLVFRADDGRFELQRKIPYDYDSEFQDLYMKVAVALIEGHINVHEALIFEQEARQGKHTAKSGLFFSNQSRTTCSVSHRSCHLHRDLLWWRLERRGSSSNYWYGDRFGGILYFLDESKAST